MYRSVLVGFIVLCQVSVSFGQTSADAIALKNQLFVTQAYDKKIRPVTNQSDPIEVYLNFYLLAINGLDEVTEVLKTTGYLWILWYDNFLTWDPTNYGQLEYYFYPQDDIWKPDVALKNSYQEYKQLGVSTLNVQVNSAGYVQWYPFQVFQSTCSMNIRNFPFDVQECSLKFVAWSYSSSEVAMLSGDSGLILDEYESNSAWDVIGSSWSVQQESGEAAISFNIKIRRKPMFIILSVVLPIALLSVLNIFVFVLPCESGERAGYAITVFLALAVFLTIVSSTLPANSDTIAIFSIYLIIQTVQSTVITLIALIMLRVHFLDENTKKPGCIISMMLFWDRLKCCKGNQSNQVSAQNGQGNTKAELLSMSVSTIQDNPNPEKGSTVSLTEEEKIYSWKNVINFMDCLCIIFFTSFFVISTIACFVASGAT